MMDEFVRDVNFETFANWLADYTRDTMPVFFSCDDSYIVPCNPYVWAPKTVVIGGDWHDKEFGKELS